MQVSLEQAYATACQKLGEAQVRETLLTEIVSQKDAEIASLKEQLVAAGVIEEATEIVEESNADRNFGQG